MTGVQTCALPIYVFSWAVVGFFYPILMFGILAIFPLTRLLAGPPAPSPRAAPALAALFAACQLAPRLLSGDPALTGEGRLFALHMFDARVTCQAWAELRRADGSRLPRNLRLHGEARTACDPIVIHGFARNLCRERDAGRLEFVDLDVHLLSRRASASEMHTVIDLPEFCAHLPRYRLFGHNEWIRTE